MDALEWSCRFTAQIHYKNLLEPTVLELSIYKDPCNELPSPHGQSLTKLLEIQFHM